ncbi:MAG: iron hydrogenase small subunit [Deltaproteobacteria bacterium]|nr:iron hydrogenase small subunit [Deltaproteobacteria bacterium]
MLELIVNDKPVKADKGEMLLSVLRRQGIDIPTLCHVEGLTPTGACRLCVVEVEGQSGLVPSCACQVYNGMKVKTHTNRLIEARRTLLELIMSSHPDDCLYCQRRDTCELLELASKLGIKERRYKSVRSNPSLDISSPSIVRDPSKCILCGRCVRVCEEIQGVGAIDFIGRGSDCSVGTAFNEGLNTSSCVNCGQCITACPVGALTEARHINRVLNAMSNPELTIVVQHAPAVSVTLGEMYNLPSAADVQGVMIAGLRKAGFDFVFDTGFSADLTIMEEASELVSRISNGGVLPMMTSCSPAWVKFVEQYYPEMIPSLSTCKSPMQMLGAITKSWWAEKNKLDKSKIFSVAVMPCTAKKFEASRPEMGIGIPDIDAVLTTRELYDLFNIKGVKPFELKPMNNDNPFGQRSTAGKLFGATGGVMEAAIRTAHFLITGENMKNPVITELRDMTGIKEARVKIGELEIGVAVASGLSNARKLLDEIKMGRKDIHFIEIMSCPGGCIGGGGQPYGTDFESVRNRMSLLYKIDKEETVKYSHENQSISELYRDFLGKPLSGKSHTLLHTEYMNRVVMK